MKKFVALAATGALLLSAGPALAYFPSRFGANILEKGSTREKAEKVMERKLNTRVKDSLKKAEENTEKAKNMKKEGRNTEDQQNYLRGVKRGWVKQLSRFDKCVDEAAGTTTLSQHCTALTEFKKLLADCKAKKEAGETLTDECRKIAKHLGSHKSKSATSASTTSASATSASATSASTTSASTSSASSGQ